MGSRLKTGRGVGRASERGCGGGRVRDCGGERAKGGGRVRGCGGRVGRDGLLKTLGRRLRGGALGDESGLRPRVPGLDGLDDGETPGRGLYLAFSNGSPKSTPFMMIATTSSTKESRRYWIIVGSF
ncbi:hypothetical protein NECAME_10719 [Necator americanus]|uniref:Uncharacterized protein n=1 Tax=Necator americanus TaxID=51031 RepID=W2T8F9_NECAM|nr:hypothetical protein NECAME_10719 [Necator americanus]ETN77914.1 hypothetical protein NECAME_10719 [Necator americanus]